MSSSPSGMVGVPSKLLPILDAVDPGHLADVIDVIAIQVSIRKRRSNLPSS